MAPVRPERPVMYLVIPDKTPRTTEHQGRISVSMLKMCLHGKMSYTVLSWGLWCILYGPTATDMRHKHLTSAQKLKAQSTTQNQTEKK